MMLLDRLLLHQEVVVGVLQEKKAARILSTAPGAISTCMWRSFVDRQYSSSIDMDQSEWKIILEELTRMGYIVKREPDSDGGE
jgi:hypothetical protein